MNYNYKHWLNKNYNKLEEKYNEYFDSIDKEFDVPISFDEFIIEEWEKVSNDFGEREDK